uniref:CDT1 domain-containing protein n=1 Tax=Panagrellus redivivus TaxID=6233 RepID=A0A7E4ZXK4_PANRE
MELQTREKNNDALNKLRDAFLVVNTKLAEPLTATLPSWYLKKTVAKGSTLSGNDLLPTSKTVNYHVDGSKPKPINKTLSTVVVVQKKESIRDVEIKYLTTLKDQAKASELYKKDDHLAISIQDVPRVFRQRLQLPKDAASKKGSEDDDASKPVPAKLFDSAITLPESDDFENGDVAGAAAAVASSESIASIDPETGRAAAGSDTVAVEPTVVSPQAGNDDPPPRPTTGEIESQNLAHAHYGTARRCLVKIIEEKPTSSTTLEIEKAIADLLDQLGWVHLASNQRSATLLKHVPAFRPF